MSQKEPNFDSKDFYEILGLSKESASEDDIRRAYKRLALKYHPDKQGQKSEEEKKDAENKFKKLAEAYEILSDKKKKQLYDEYGLEGLGMASGSGSTGGSFYRNGGFDNHFTFQHAEDIFRNFFGGRDPFADFFDDDDGFMGGGFGGFGR